MAKNVTLSDLRTRVREAADVVGSTYISDAELDRKINDAIDQYWNKITATDEDYTNSSSNISVTSSTNYASLPATFFKLRGVDDLRDPSYPMTVLPFNFAERNDHRHVAIARLDYLFSPVRYRIIGDNIYFEPKDQCAGTYKLWFVPVATTLVNGADTINLNGWHELVVTEAAIRIKGKEESDATTLFSIRATLLADIEAVINSRDRGMPRTVSKVRRQALVGSLNGR